MGRTAWVAACIVSLFVMAATAGAAQITGGVEGRVVDQTAATLPGVTVVLRTGPTTRATVTDAGGTYAFSAVSAGDVQLAFSLINFAEARREVRVQAGAVVRVDVTLALSLSADITVTGSRTFRNLADLPNPAENVVGIALAASQGAITARQLEVRPIMRAGEVLETVPGVIISQHSGEGKANQYYLRGFNLDHGTDFATTVAGVPVNLPTHAHGHGYSDLNFLIPELVSGVQFRKGPYYAEDGDFSTAGSANINYVNALDRPILYASGGQDGWGRILGAVSPSIGDGHLLAAVEVNHNDGPWTLPDDYRKLNAVVRYSRGNTQNGLSITGMGYRADWASTDQVPARAVTDGRIPRFGFIDATDGGETHRYSLAADVQRGGGKSVTRATAFLVNYGLNLFSNFTYYLDDPENGDQFEQEDRRWIAGGRATYRHLSRWWDRSVESAVGLQIRQDWIGNVALYETRARQRLSTTRADRVAQTSIGLFAQSEVEWTHTFRTLLGLRGDLHRFEVASDRPVNSGVEWDGVVSPKITAIVGPWSGAEVYASAGMGFHSNDARGATIAVDPITSEPVERVTPLAKARGAEIGVRTVRIPGVQMTAALWTLGIDSELLFVGDAGTTEPSRRSRRYGIEWTTYARLRPWLTLDADVSWSRSQFTDPDPAGDHIPGAVTRVVSLGLSVEEFERLFGSLRLRYFGPRPLVENDSVRSRATTLLNLQAGYRLWSRGRLVLDVFNLLDAEDSDIDYSYTSRLPDEPPEGVDDIHLHPALPRTARLTLEVVF